MIMQHNLTQRPDMFRVIPGGHLRNNSASMVTMQDNYNGDWFFETNTTMFSYMGQ